MTKINWKDRYADREDGNLINALSDLARDIHAFQIDVGYYSLEEVILEMTRQETIEEEDSFKLRQALIMTRLGLITTEVAEAMEVVRKAKQYGVIERSPNISEFDHLTEELADIIIRTLDLAAYLHLSVGSAIIAKLEYIQDNAEHRKDKVI